MKKLLLSTLMVMSVNTYAVFNEATLHESSMSYEQLEEVLNMSTTTDKPTFKRRTYSGYNMLVKINTNFKAPVVGKDTYFGYIYTVPGNTTTVKYRDEITAEDNYKSEINNPSSQYMSSYNVSDFRAANGLELINAAGAYVRLKSKDFTMANGGTLNLSFKIPLQKAGAVDIIVKKESGQLRTYVKNSRGSLVRFDSLSLNAKRAVITGTSILNGVRNIEFKSGSSAVHTYEM
jgi:hypothetical protein